MRHYFGTLHATVLSLGMAMSGGKDWGDIYDALALLSWTYKFLFFIFEGFCFLALLNVVTAVTVESTVERNNKDRESLVLEEMLTRRVFLNAIRELFHEFDKDGDNEVSAEEMKERLKEPAVLAYFASLGVSIDRIDTLFALLDSNASGSVDEEEFVSGCMRLRGDAKCIDIAILQSHIDVLIQTLVEMTDKMEKTETMGFTQSWQQTSPMECANNVMNVSKKCSF